MEDGPAFIAMSWDGFLNSHGMHDTRCHTMLLIVITIVMYREYTTLYYNPYGMYMYSRFHVFYTLCLPVLLPVTYNCSREAEL